MPDHNQANTPDPAIRAYIKRLGGPEAFAAKHSLSLRTAQRIYTGSRPCPNRLRDEIERICASLPPSRDGIPLAPSPDARLMRVDRIGLSPKMLPRPIMAPGSTRKSGEITGIWVDELIEPLNQAFVDLATRGSSVTFHGNDGSIHSLEGGIVIGPQDVPEDSADDQ